MKNDFLKKIFKNLFIVFLLFYFFTMLIHIGELDKNLLTLFLFIAGLVLALFAHAKKNYVTVILLVLHMSIEWFEWSQMHFSIFNTLFNMGHVLMDFVFLSHELTAHAKKYRYQILFGVSIFLITVFGFSRFFLSDILQVESSLAMVEPFVVGGVIGCVSSHLFYHLKRLGRKDDDGGECCHEH